MRENSYTRFISHLKTCNAGELARLRRSLSSKPGEHIIPAVEMFIPEEWEWQDWRRQMHYLVAGLFASATRSVSLESPVMSADGQGESSSETSDKGIADTRDSDHNLASSIAKLYIKLEQRPSIEQRFVILLDSESEELSYRLRQMMQLIHSQEGIPIHWASLLRDLIGWQNESRRQRIRQSWARTFYRTVRRHEAPKGDRDQKAPTEGNEK